MRKLVFYVACFFLLGACEKYSHFKEGADFTPNLPVILPNPEFEKAWQEFRKTHLELSEADALTEFLKEVRP